VIKTVEDGIMTKDLGITVHGKNVTRDNYVTLDKFLSAVKEKVHDIVS
jgi:isocitrate dehydrogenase